MKVQKLDPKLLELIWCPICHGDLLHGDAQSDAQSDARSDTRSGTRSGTQRAQTLSCAPCKTVWPIRRGVPLLVPEEAKRLRS